MQYKKKVNTLLYIAAVSAFVATLITYNLPRGINVVVRNLLPAKVIKRINFVLTANPVNFSEITISFVGILITFGIFTGISLIFLRRKTDA